VYLSMGFLDSARSEFEEAKRLCSRGEARCTLSTDGKVSMLGYRLAAAGVLESSQGIARLRRLSEEQYVPACWVAACYASTGDIDQAFTWVAKAVEERSSWLIYLAVDPAFDPIRDDPRFARLLRTIGLVGDTGSDLEARSSRPLPLERTTQR